MRRRRFLTWDQLKVGAFVTVALGLLIFAIVRLGSSMRLFSRHYQLYTLLPTASGLRVGGAVTVAGQQAGTVKRIEFLPVDDDTTKNLLVVLDVDERVREQVRTDSRVYLRTLGLLGDKTLDISPGTPRSPMLREGDTLIAYTILDYDRLIVQAADAVDDVVALTADLRGITAGLLRGEGTLGLLLRDTRIYDDLNLALRNSNAVLARVRDSRGTFGRLLEDTTLYGQFLTTVAAVDSLADRFASDRGTIGRLLSDSSIFMTLNNAALTADSLLKAVSAGQGAAGKFLREDLLYDQLLQSVTDLRLVLDDFRRNPARYTRGIIRIF